MDYINYFAFAIPFFILAIMAELAIHFFTRMKLYKFHDIINNIGLGIGQQALDVFLKIYIISGYKLIYDLYRVTTIPVNVYTGILLFILIDLSYYWFHRCAHFINLLWGTHIVHHQSEEFNFSVALRQSWFDNVFNFFFYIPLAFIGFDDMLFFALFSINTIYQFLIHTKTIKSLGFFEIFLNTPSHHRVHHGKNVEYIDKNFGGVLIIWDKIFGTFIPENESVIYGVTSPVKSNNPITLNFHYWKTLLYATRYVVDWKNKIYLIFSTPENVGNILPPIDANEKNNLQTFYIGNKIYVFIQLLISIIILGTLFDYENELALIEKFKLVLFLIISLTCIGGLLDNVLWAKLFEPIRLVFMYPIYNILNVYAKYDFVKSIIVTIILFMILFHVLINLKFPDLMKIKSKSKS